jgi:glyoxylase-like metal-dependent hydrolase (beta-lactamase superfamily II)
MLRVMPALGPLCAAAVAFMTIAPVVAQGAGPWAADILEIRSAATLVPGARPARVNAVKFAESRRTKNFSVKGAPAEPSVQARTAFQVVYEDGSIMIDAGMDREIHSFFGRGVQEPYDAPAFARVEAALEAARLIVVTHEHGDHVAGVIAGTRAAALAPKTLLTRAQVQSLMTKPQMPEIGLTAERASRYVVVDYDRYLPIAPGVVLIRAGGHTPGSQMVFVTLASGREYLLIGDIAWHMDGVRSVTGKDAPWVSEDQPAIMSQLAWLNGLLRTDPDLVIVASHDDDELRDLTLTGMLGNRLE